MTGLERIIEEIGKEAEALAAASLQEAEGRASRIGREAEAACLSIAEEAEKEGQRRREAILRRRRSAAGMQKRQELLAVRQEQLDRLLREARESLYSLEEKKYFELLLSIAGRCVREGSGEIRFSPRDLERLPSDFEKRLKKLAAERGGSLEISEETCGDGGGFLLIYGGIEENCSFEAIFEEAGAELRDRLQKLLFPGRGGPDEK